MTTDPCLLELLRVLLLKKDGNYTDIPITLKKTITIGDIITLDRAVNMDINSVVYFVKRIDPAEGEANLENLRKALLRSQERLRSNIPRRIQRAVYQTISWRHVDNDLCQSFSLNTKQRLQPISMRPFRLRKLEWVFFSQMMRMILYLFI